MIELAVLCIAVCLVAVAVDQFIVRRSAYYAVFEHLDTIASNGYAIEYLEENTPEHIANHILYATGDVRLRGIGTNLLARYVRAWLFHRGVI